MSRHGKNRAAKQQFPETKVAPVIVSAQPLAVAKPWVDIRAVLGQVAADFRIPRPSWPDRYIYFLLLVPLVVLAGNPDVIFTPAGSIDPWVYYGFFRHLAVYKAGWFSGTYYGSRLSWILPGFIVTHLFPPLLANYVLHLGVYFTAVLSVFYIVRQAFGRRTALLAGIVFGFHPYLWQATGWDYVDGAGIAYFLLTVLFLFRATGRRRPAALLFLAGASYAALIYSNLLWLLYSPVYPLLYFGLRDPGLDTHRWWSRLAHTGWCAAGSMAVSLLFGTVNFWLERVFLFYLPSVSYAWMTGNHTTEWKQPGWRWLLNAPWLLPPLIVLLAVMIGGLAIFRKRSPVRGNRQAIFVSMYLYSVLAIVGIELYGLNPLEFPFSVSFLLPTAILALSATAFRTVEDLDIRTATALVAVGVVVFAAIWFAGHGHPVLRVPPYLLMAGAVLVVAGAAAGRRPIALVVLLVGMASTLLYDRYVDYTLNAGGPGPRKDAFIRTVRAMETVETTRVNHLVRFWFDDHEQYGAEFHSISSCYLSEYTSAGFAFPKWKPIPHVGPDQLIVILSGRRDVIKDATPVLLAQGLVPGSPTQNKIASGGAGYWITFIPLERQPQAAVSH